MKEKISQIGKTREETKQILNESLGLLNTECVHDIKHQVIHSPLEKEQSLNLVRKSARVYLSCLNYYELLKGIIRVDDIYNKQRAETILRLT